MEEDRKKQIEKLRSFREVKVRHTLEVKQRQHSAKKEIKDKVRQDRKLTMEQILER